MAVAGSGCDVFCVKICLVTACVLWASSITGSTLWICLHFYRRLSGRSCLVSHSLTQVSCQDAVLSWETTSQFALSITPQNVQVRRKWWQTVVTDDDDATTVEMFVCVWTVTVWLYVSVVSSLLSTFRLIQTTENVPFTHWSPDILFFWHIILDILVFHHRPLTTIQSWLVVVVIGRSYYLCIVSVYGICRSSFVAYTTRSA